MGGELGLELVRDGWEPLVQRYHWCFSTQPGVVLTLLSDHKGTTARSKAKGVKWLGVVVASGVVVVRWLKPSCKVLLQVVVVKGLRLVGALRNRG